MLIEEFEDTKRAIRIRISKKDGKQNGQKIRPHIYYFGRCRAESCYL